jgi:SAM-dependent methyltransferase
MTSEAITAAEYTVRDQERMRNATRYFEWQFRLAEPHLGKRVLEIGCGLGNFTRHLLDRELLLSIDSEAACVAQHRSRFADYLNVVTLREDIQDPAFLHLSEYAPDSAVCLNVLEHVKDDVCALNHIYGVLPPRGKLVVIVPAFKSLYGPIDQRLGHYRRYSKVSLAQAAARAAFRIQTLRYMNGIGFFGWWVNARILKRTEQSPAQIAVFDAIAAPFLPKVEALIEPSVGQSVYAVLEKPE